MAVKRNKKGQWAGSTSSAKPGFRGIFAGMEPGRQFTLFHGARQALPEGETHILPPSKTGASTWASAPYTHDDGTSHTETAFATPHEHTAGHYMRDQSVHPDDPVNNDPHPRHRSVLYEVAVPDDAVGDPRRDSEIASRSGFPIVATHHSLAGATSTFHEINWNAYKAKPTGHSSLVSSRDANHSYMEVDLDRPVHVPPPYAEGKNEQDNRYRAPDARHPDQLNLFTGKTVTEHKAYENTPGMMIETGRGAQFDEVAFRRDPSVKTIRRSKSYHRVDEQFGTVH